MTDSTYLYTFHVMHDSQRIHKCQGLGDHFCSRRYACNTLCRHRNMSYGPIPVEG